MSDFNLYSCCSIIKDYPIEHRILKNICVEWFVEKRTGNENYLKFKTGDITYCSLEGNIIKPEIYINEFFTLDEITKFAKYLSEKSIHCKISEHEFPIEYDEMRYIHKELSNHTIKIELAKLSDYNLPFEIVGYYNCIGLI